MVRPSTTPEPSYDVWRGTDLDELILPKTAANELPRRRRGAKVALPTIYRWMNRGVRGIRLRYVCVGGTRCTTRRWLAEFFDLLTEESAGQPATPSDVPRCTRALRRRESEAVERELDEIL